MPGEAAGLEISQLGMGGHGNMPIDVSEVDASERLRGDSAVFGAAMLLCLFVVAIAVLASGGVLIATGVLELFGLLEAAIGLPSWAGTLLAGFTLVLVPTLFSLMLEFRGRAKSALAAPTEAPAEEPARRHGPVTVETVSAQ